MAYKDPAKARAYQRRYYYKKIAVDPEFRARKCRQARESKKRRGVNDIKIVREWRRREKILIQEDPMYRRYALFRQAEAQRKHRYKKKHGTLDGFVARENPWKEHKVSITEWWECRKAFSN